MGLKPSNGVNQFLCQLKHRLPCNSHQDRLPLVIGKEIAVLDQEQVLPRPFCDKPIYTQQHCLIEATLFRITNCKDGV